MRGLGPGRPARGRTHDRHGDYRQGPEGRDDALRELAKKYVELTDIAVSEEEREAAYDEVDVEVIEALVEAHARIERFHELQKPKNLWFQEMEPGIVLGMKTTALNRVGIYVPGGRAAYPSSALMCAVPALVAGVKEVCACSPPADQAPDARCPRHRRGHRDLQRRRSTGRGRNGTGDRDNPAGAEDCRPREHLCHPCKDDAPGTCRDRFPGWPKRDRNYCRQHRGSRVVAADVMAQAEHDPNAACILITTDKTLRQKLGARSQRSSPRRRGERSSSRP